MAYQVTNISRTPIYENLDTVGPDGKREVFQLGVREKKVLSDAQWGSFSVQRHLERKRLRSRKVS